MNVEHLMTREVHTCRPTDTLDRVAKTLWDADCGAVPAIDEAGKVLGIVTDRDLCMAAYHRGEPLHALRVEETMAREVKTCRFTDTVAVAQETMRAARVRRLPVVDGQGKLVGIVTLNDLARASRAGDLSTEQVALTLADVTRPWWDLSEPKPVATGSVPAPAPAAAKPAKAKAKETAATTPTAKSAPASKSSKKKPATTTAKKTSRRPATKKATTRKKKSS